MSEKRELRAVNESLCDTVQCLENELAIVLAELSAVKVENVRMVGRIMRQRKELRRLNRRIAAPPKPAPLILPHPKRWWQW